MKRILSFILTLMLVFTIGTSVVMADEYVENYVEMYEANGYTADNFAQELAVYGLTLDKDAMQIKDAETGEALSEEEFNAKMDAWYAEHFVEDFVSYYTQLGMTVEQITEALATMGMVLDVENMRITDAATGKVLTAEEFDAMLNGTSSNTTAQSDGTTSSNAVVDNSSAVEIYVFDVKNSDEIKFTGYVTGDDAFLDQQLAYSETTENPFVETTYEGKRALKTEEKTYKASELANEFDIGYVYEKGFFKDEYHYFMSANDHTESNYENGKVVKTIVFKFGEDTEKRDIVVGRDNSFMITDAQINWVNVLIVAMSFIVLVLIAVTIIITIKSKKKVENKEAQKNDKYVSEDEVFDKLVEEAGVEVYEDDISEEEIDDIEIIEIDGEAEEFEEEK